MDIHFEAEFNGLIADISVVEAAVADGLKPLALFELVSQGVPFEIVLENDSIYRDAPSECTLTLRCKDEWYSASAGEPESAIALASRLCEYFLAADDYLERTGRPHPYKDPQQLTNLGSACLANVLGKPHRVKHHLKEAKHTAERLADLGEQHQLPPLFLLAADIYDGLDLLEELDLALKRGSEIASGEIKARINARQSGRAVERELGSQLYGWLLLFGILNTESTDQAASVALAVLLLGEGLSMTDLSPTLGRRLAKLPRVGSYLVRASQSGETNNLEVAVCSGRRALTTLLGEANFRRLLTAQDLDKQLVDLKSACSASTPIVSHPLGRRALVAEATGDLVQALSAYEAALQQTPDLHPIRIRYAQLLWKAGRGEECLKELTTVLKCDPDNRKSLLLRGSLLCDVQGDYASAERDFDQLLSLDPTADEAWFGKANVCQELDKLEEALYAAEQAILFAGHSHLNWFKRGEILMRLGRFQEAAQDLETSAEMGELSPVLQMHLVQAVRTTGDLSRATELLDTMERHPLLDAQRGMLLAKTGDRLAAVDMLTVYLKSDLRCPFDDEIRKLAQELKMDSWFQGVYGDN